MQIIGIYAKEYDCSKCNGKINYGQASKDGKTPVTKDGKPFNNKYGKESNVLSVAVNAGTTEIHPCYSSYAIKDYDELTGAIQAGPDVSLNGMSNSEVEGYDEFIDIVKSLYVKLNYEAGKFCGEGAMAKDKHITTMGLIHDYFSFRNLK
jgi:hypothetical protein